MAVKCHFIMKIVLFSSLILSSMIFHSCSGLGEGKIITSPKREKKILYNLWTKNLDPKYETGNLPIAFHSPTVYEGLLFIGDQSGVMRSFNVDTGRQIWETKDNGGISNQAIFQDNLIIYGTDEGHIIARDYITGNLRYSVNVGAAVMTQGAVSQGRIFFHLKDHKIVSLDALTGKILWVYRRSITATTTIEKYSKPTIYKNKLYSGFSDGSVVCFSFEDGSLLWETNISERRKFVDVIVTPLVKNNILYVSSFTGMLTLMNPDNGLILRKLPYLATRAPLFNGSQAYLGTRDGKLLLLSEEGNVKKEITLNDAVLAMKWEKDKLIVAVQNGDLIAFNSNLEELDKFSLGHRFSTVFGDLVSYEDKLSVLSSRNRLYVFKILE